MDLFFSLSFAFSGLGILVAGQPRLRFASDWACDRGTNCAAGIITVGHYKYPFPLPEIEGGEQPSLETV